MSKFFIYPPSSRSFLTPSCPRRRGFRTILPPQLGEGWGGGQPGGEKLGEGARRAGEGLPVGKIQAAPGWGAKKAQPK